MIYKLFIQNYAIIDRMEINFLPGLNIITGETGAGKSILIGALSLILGARADNSQLHSDNAKCIVEGCFSVNGNEAVQFFLKNNDLDNENELIIRRELSASGKSRGFINDTPVSLQQMRELASLLVDLHQQFDTQELGDSAFQRTVIDALAGNENLLQQYKKAFYQWREAQKKWKAIQEQKAEQNREQDYLLFQFNELNDAALTPDELENLEKELQLLTHAEDIKKLLAETAYTINDSDQPVSSLLKQLANRLDSYSQINPKIAALSERLHSTQIELEDIGAEAASLAEDTSVDAERMDYINERLSLGYKLLKKHGVTTTAGLLQIQEELDKKLQAFAGIAEDEAHWQEKAAAEKKTAEKLAAQLKAAREKQIVPVEKSINLLLTQVGMPNARLKISITATENLSASGKDDTEFLFDANKSDRFEPIRKVASGGERSRLMLCIKSLVARSVQLPTLIFDEIDTGISGEAARQVGIIMKQLSEHLQLIAITHQPQIAGKADAHFFVYKQPAENGMITAAIKHLSEKEHINAIAQMIGGEHPSAAALANARELVENT